MITPKISYVRANMSRLIEDSIELERVGLYMTSTQGLEQEQFTPHLDTSDIQYLYNAFMFFYATFNLLS